MAAPPAPREVAGDAYLIGTGPCWLSEGWRRTIERVENDAEGATYEAHMTKADGSQVTVKLDASFTVTGIETGH